MPNWCENVLRVTGPAEDRGRLAQLWTDGKGVFDRILPAPNPFTDQDLANLHREVERSWGFPGELDRMNAGNAWYYWNNIHWGTKWDVGGDKDSVTVVEEEEVTTIDFLTAWGPPLPVIKAMSVLYPSLDFDLTYCEPGMCFAGEAHFVTGEGQDKCYGYDAPEYERIASEFGYGTEDYDDEVSEQDSQEGA